MKNVKRIALCVIAMMLVCQIACASMDLSGGWYGTVSAIGYKSPQVYGVIDGVNSGKFRLVVPNVGSKLGLTGSFNWATGITGDRLELVVSARGRTAKMAIPQSDIYTNKKGKLFINGEIPAVISALGAVDFQLVLTPDYANVKKVSSTKAKVGQSATISVKTSPVTDYVVLTDKENRVLAIDTDIINQNGAMEYSGWTKGKNTLYVYAGLKDADNNVKIKAAVGDVLSQSDLSELSKGKKLVKKAK